MSVSVTMYRNLRKRREKVFGRGLGVPLDRNAKIRIMAYARGYNASHKQAGQHRGPLTRAFLEVLQALLWGFHNSKGGLCYPSYESIAKKAECNRDTVYEAIKALEEAGVLTWVNRLTRARVLVDGLFGKTAVVWRVIRTSNSYVFQDPMPCVTRVSLSKSENPPKTLNQDPYLLSLTSKSEVSSLENGLDSALKSLGRRLGAILDENLNHPIPC